MTVSVEKLEDSKVSLQVKVPRQTVDEALDRAFKKLVKQVNVPGFRRGKAPRSIFLRFYGEGALIEEALKELLPEEYRKACEETHIEPVDEPEFLEPNVDEEGLTFKAKVYVRPEVKMGKYEELQIPFETPKEVTEEDIQKQIEQLRERMAELAPLPDDAALENGNYVTINLKGVEGGDVKSKLDEDLQYYPVGNDNPLVPGLSQALIGMKKGEVKEFDSVFKVGRTEEDKKASDTGDSGNKGEDETHSKPQINMEANNESPNADEPEENSDESPKGASDEVSGQKKTEVSLRFRVEVKECYEKRVPKDDQELAKRLGKASSEEAKNEIRKTLADLRLDVAREQFMDKVEEELLKMSEIETVPHAMIQRRAEEILERLNRRLADSGSDLDSYAKASHKTWEQVQEEIEKDAEKDVKRDLILDFIAEKDKVRAPESRVDGVIEAIAKDSGQDPKALKTTLEIRGSLEDIRRQMNRVAALEKVAKGAAQNAGTEFPEAKEPEHDVKENDVSQDADIQQNQQVAGDASKASEETEAPKIGEEAGAPRVQEVEKTQG